MTTKELAQTEQMTPAASPPRITPGTIQETTQGIALLQGMVKDILVRGIDYGRIPGMPQDSLWDPGASQIIGSFNCYCGQRRILKLEDSDERIVACVEVPIISRATQQEVGSGIGAASTLETKYKYRWVANPKQWGYDEAAIKTFKTKRGKDEEGNNVTLYRIPNPEHSELLNTIVKMASKRAEVDAAESLPGVASVLRQMFSAKPARNTQLPSGSPNQQQEEGKPSGERWRRFHGNIRRLGYTDPEAKAIIGVESWYDWLDKGRSLDEAEDILRKHNAHQPKTEEIVDAQTGEIISQDEDLFGEGEEAGIAAPAEAHNEEPTGSAAPAKLKRDPETIRTSAELYRACHEDFKLQPKDVLKELGYSSQADITETPAECYRKITAVRD